MHRTHAHPWPHPPKIRTNMIDYLVEKKYFRNENHAIWFLCSFGIAIFTITTFLKPSQYLFLLIPAIVHMPPLITSSIRVFARKESSLYSKDCIWFNAIMILIYLGFFIILRF